MWVYKRAVSLRRGSIGAAVEGWGFEDALALMTVVLAMVAVYCDRVRVELSNDTKALTKLLGCAWIRGKECKRRLADVVVVTEFRCGCRGTQSFGDAVRAAV